MAEQITLEEALELVEFNQVDDGSWCVVTVNGDVRGDVCGYVGGDVGDYVGGTVCGNVGGTVRGDVCGNVGGTVSGYVGGDVRGGVGGAVGGAVGGDVRGYVGGYVRGTIKGRRWQFVETPKEKLQRLINETGNNELLEAFNQMEEQYHSETGSDHDKFSLIAILLVLTLVLLLSFWWLPQKWQGCQKIYDNRLAQTVCLLA